MAKNCLVFIVVYVNEGWKFPIGYFLTSSLTSIKKADPTKQTLYLLKATSINIVSLTFDGTSTNITMALLLNCDFSISTLKTNFGLDFFDKEKTDIAIFLDSSHIIKLERNIFEEKLLF